MTTIKTLEDYLAVSKEVENRNATIEELYVKLDEIEVELHNIRTKKDQIDHDYELLEEKHSSDDEIKDDVLDLVYRNITHLEFKLRKLKYQLTTERLLLEAQNNEDEWNLTKFTKDEFERN